MMLDILRRFAELDIQFAYPTQTSLHRRARRAADHALSGGESDGGRRIVILSGF